MKTSLKNIDPTQAELTIELDSTELKKYLDDAETDLAANIEIDGFRKGKAPKSEVRKRLGEQAVLQAGLEHAIEKSFSSAILEHKLDVVSTDNLQIKENTPEKLLYTIQASLYPTVKLGDISKVKVKKKEVEVSEEEIQKAIDTVRSSRVSYDPKDGPVENGDKVEMDFQVTKDGKVIEGGESKNHPLIVGKNTFLPGFEENLVGMLKGEEKEFTIKVPKDYFHKDIAGKEVACKVKINSIHKVILPELNDEFVKSVGKFNSADHLKESIRDGILMEKKNQEIDKARIQAINEIIALSEIAIPKTMIESQLDSMISDFDHNLHSKGLELGFYLAQIGKTQDELRKDWQPDAERQVKSLLVVRQIAKDKSISVSTKEIDDTANEVVQDLVSRGQKDISTIDIQRLKESVAQKMISERTLEFIESLCVE